MLERDETQRFLRLHAEQTSDYTPDGGVIEVRATLDKAEAIVHVVDNGIGIHKEMQARIFDLFTQASSAGDRAKGGLGIGLSLAKNFVELHGGSLQVRSDGAGKGSEFALRLPLAAPTKAPDA
jgi:signal transduction histidine kinase